MLDVQSLGIFTAKYSTKQGVTFVIECLLGIGLIFYRILSINFKNYYATDYRLFLLVFLIYFSIPRNLVAYDFNHFVLG